MNNLISKNSIYILFKSKENSALNFADNYNNYEIVENAKNNCVTITIDKDFYNSHKLFSANLINKQINSKNFNSIVLDSLDFIKTLPSEKGVSYNNLYITKNCNFDIETIFDHSIINNFSHIVFENDIDVKIAFELYKHKINFLTTKNFELLDLKKFSGNNDLYTFSDYFYLTKLNVLQNISEKDLDNLNTLFGFNRCLYDINLSCDLKNAKKIVELYTNNISQFNFSTFNLNLKNILISNEDRENLYEISKMLKSTNSNFTLTFGKETITYEKYIATIKPLKKYANKINSSNLSPLEKLVLIEDYIKTKPYTDSENKNISRNFFSSLNSKYVVCFTYVYTFKTLCDLCGINSSVANCKIAWFNGTVSEHAKIICNVNDKKYNYKGVLIFDPTFDAKDQETIFDEEKPTDNFLFFANTLNQSKFYKNFSTREFGLLNLALDKSSIKEEAQNIEACAQINELNKTNIVPYLNGKLTKEYKLALNSTIHTLQKTQSLTFSTFADIITFARQNFDPMDLQDIDRIKNINSYKSLSYIEKNSDNMFVNENPFNELLDDEGEFGISNPDDL